MKEDKKLKYYAMYYDWNDHEVGYTNVLRSEIIESLSKMVKKGANRHALRERLVSLFKYYYWSKSEYEILVNSLSNREEHIRKIDIWFQLEPNVDVILDYILTSICPRKFKRGDFSDESNRV